MPKGPAIGHRQAAWVQLPDDVLADLFEQSLVGGYRGEPYMDGLRRLARLFEAELQGRLMRREKARERRSAAPPSEKNLEKSC